MFEIRKLTTLAEMQPIEQLQRDIWNYGSTNALIYPSRLFFTYAKTGGLVLGAYEDNTLIGFSAALLGRQQNCFYLFSQLTGVQKSHNGIGSELKFKQREYALNDGIEMIRWTFDPLQPSNGYFNFHKLRATSGKFDQDLYGDLGGAQNLSLGSDRLTADWHLSTKPIETPLLDTINCVNPIEGEYSDLQDEFLSMRIPADFKHIRAKEPARALLWQEITRTMMSRYLPRYFFVDAARTAHDTFYIMQRR